MASPSMIEWLELLARLSTPSPDWGVAGAVATVATLILMVGGVLLIPLKYVWRRFKEMLVARSPGAAGFDRGEISACIKHYVHPDCSIVDPAGEDDLRQLIAFRKPVFQVIDDFLRGENAGKHILLLADSGMGKTSFLVNYYEMNLRRFRNRLTIVVIPLGRPDVIERIAAIQGKHEKILMLDAFDEDTAAIKDHRTRIQELMSASADFRRIVITCRSQFFASDEEMPKETGVAIVRPRKAGERRIYRFYKLYLAPFTDAQARRYLHKRFLPWRPLTFVRARRLMREIPDLAVRPMLLAVMPDLVQKGRSARDLHDVFEFMVDAWLEREADWIAKDILLAFSKRLAVDIYMNRQRRQSERLPRSELDRHITERLPDVEAWKLTSRSLLNRDAEGNYKFAHRSIMEFLFIRAFVEGQDQCADVEWTDLMMNLFVTWAIREDSGAMLKHDLSDTGVFPLFKSGRDPIAVPAQDLLEASRSHPRHPWLTAAWSPAFVSQEMDEHASSLYMCDLATDLVWCIPAFPHVPRTEVTRLAQLNYAESKNVLVRLNESGVHGRANWREPTVDEFAQLYQMAAAQRLDQHACYWTSDRADRSFPVLASMRRHDHPHLNYIGIKPLSMKHRAVRVPSGAGGIPVSVREAEGIHVFAATTALPTDLRAFAIRVSPGGAEAFLLQREQGIRAARRSAHQDVMADELAT